MKKLAVLCALLIWGTNTYAPAIDIKGSPPEFAVTGEYESITDELNSAIRLAFYAALGEIENEIGGIDDKPENFIQAWGNASVFSGQGAAQRGYAGYKNFAVTAGSMIGVQLPGSPFSLRDDIGAIEDTLNNEHDFRAGLNPQLLSGQIGINTSRFLLENLYLGLRFGYMKMNLTDYLDDYMGENAGDNFSFNNISLGFSVNYQLVPHKILGRGAFLWRGINLGSGFIYQKTAIDYGFKIDTFTTDIDLSFINNDSFTAARLNVDAGLAFNLAVTTFTIPVEVITSVRLLWFLNLALGAGVDFGFGLSSMRAAADGAIRVTGFENIGIRQVVPGTLSVNAGGDMEPDFFNPRLMAGFGVSLGPVLLDIPVTYYFLGNGFNAGITVGAAW